MEPGGPRQQPRLLKARLLDSYVSTMQTTIIRIMATQLVPLPEVERLGPTVIRILGGNPGKASPFKFRFMCSRSQPFLFSRVISYVNRS
jgi:hypothetical protein